MANGTSQTINSNGMIGADSNTIAAVGGNATPLTGNGGAATANMNGNIYFPMGANLTVSENATGGNGVGTGNGGKAAAAYNGNIISTSHALGTINISSIATGGTGATGGSATDTVNGNIISYNNAAATNVVLNAEATALGEVAGNTGATYGTKVANLNGNIITGNVNSVSLFASAFYANSTATINGNIVSTRPTDTGTVLVDAMGQKITVNGNIFTLGQQNFTLELDELGPQYSATVAGNIINGTGVNTFTILETQNPPASSPDTVNINLSTNSFTFNGQNNIINNIPNVTLGAGISGRIVGTSGNNVLNGSTDNANLIFFGNGGTDTITGGTGLNTAQFAGSEWQYTTVTPTSVIGGPVGNTSNDTLSGIQRLKFLSPSHVRDFNNDGYGDLLFQDTATGDNRVELSNGAVPSPITISPGLTWTAIGTGQFTADTDRNAGILLQTGNGNLEFITNVTTGPVTTGMTGVASGSFNGWTAVTAGDFNGDGASDVLLQQGPGGPAEIAFLNTSFGEGVGKIDKVSTVTTPGANWNAISSGDFNADGYSDILWQNSATSSVDVSLMNGATGTPTAVGTNVGFTAIGTGDFNGDGNSDILFRNNATGDAQIWLMNGATQQGPAINVTGPGVGWTLKGAEDVNKDGFSDILWQNTTTGQTEYQAMTTGSTTLGPLTLLGTAPGPTFGLVASTGGG